MKNDLADSPAANAIAMENATLDFGGGAGVFDLDFTLPAGSILGMIGPSGCGKTTTIRLINGIYGPTSGKVRVFGNDPLKFNEINKASIGYIPQQFILYPNLTVEENLHFLGGIYGMPARDRKAKMRSMLEFVDLQDANKRLGRKLSGGMQRRLMLAGALFHDPDLLIADEPTAGIDPILRNRIWGNFRSLRDQGKTLLVTTQYVGEAAFCDRVALMRKGRLVTLDTPKGLQRQAMGGEAIHLQVDLVEFLKVIHFLEDLPQVIRVDRLQGDPGGMHVLVDNAGKELPGLLMSLKEALGVTPQKAEPYLPPFDEVFVRLIQSSEKNQSLEVAQ